MSRRKSTKFNYSKQFDQLFAQGYEQLSLDDHLESLRAKGLQYRTKLTKSGNMLEVEIYPINPVWKLQKGQKRAKVTTSREEQARLNLDNTRKRVSRLVHANFTRRDIWVTFNYGHMHMPKDIAEASRHLKNYFDRLKRHIKKHNLLELKYIYVTERVENEKTGKVHTHHHIIMNFQDRDTAEALWTLGGRTQSRRLQPDQDGSLGGLARYISKPETKEGNRKGAKTYATSKNLKKPEVRTADNKLPGTNYRLSKKRVAEMVADESKIADVLTNNYSGFILTQLPKAKLSEYTAGAYIYARLMKAPIRSRKEVDT